jgi:plastocyanin
MKALKVLQSSSYWLCLPAAALFLAMISLVASAADVDMGNLDPPCGSFGATDIGFVDCTSNTGGIIATATTTISPGGTVRWTMRSTPHNVVTEAALTGGPAAACGTGDKFDSGIANAFSPGFVYTHTFKKPGTCAYFCIVHPITMQGQVIIATTTASTTPTTTKSKDKAKGKR